MTQHKFGQSVTFAKDPSVAIKRGLSSPDYTWGDLEGLIRPDPIGANSPSLTAFRGGTVRAFAFGATDKIDMEFHMPHDYAVGTDVFLHLHWSHNGTAISGNLIVDYGVTYAKGHYQASFPAEVSPQQTIAITDINSHPQYEHFIDEFQLSASSPSATQIDTDDLETDGIILANLTVNTIPTITGGSPNEPFIFMLDLHYESTGLGTPQKSPNFYA